MSQGIDVHLDDVADAVEMDVPDVLDDQRPGHRSVAVAHQEFEQRVFLGPEVDSAAAPRHSPPYDVHLEIRHVQPGFARLAAAKQGTKARRELRERERLDHVVVGAAVEACDTLLERALCRQNQHRQIRLLRSDVAKHLEPRAPWQHEVENRGVVLDAVRLLARRGPVVQQVDGVPFLLEAPLNERRDLSIVFNYQNAHGLAETDHSPSQATHLSRAGLLAELTDAAPPTSALLTPHRYKPRTARNLVAPAIRGCASAPALDIAPAPEEHGIVVSTDGLQPLTRDCLDPWNNLEISARGEVRPCCNFDSIGRFDSDGRDIRGLRNTGAFRALRESLLSGNLQSPCQRCHIRSTVPVVTLKQRVEAAVRDLPSPDPLDPLPIAHVRIDINEKCNLRCDYCAVSSPSYAGVEMEDELFERIVPLLANEPGAIVHVNGHGETTFHPKWVAWCRRIVEAGHRPVHHHEPGQALHRCGTRAAGGIPGH